jgi:hypothetical protein
LPRGLQGGDERDAEEPEGEGPDEALCVVSIMMADLREDLGCDLHCEEKSELLHHLCHSWVLGEDAIV